MNEYPPGDDYRAYRRPRWRLSGFSLILFLLGLAAGVFFAGRLQHRSAVEPQSKPAPRESRAFTSADLAAAENYDRLVAEVTKQAMPAVVSVHVTGTVVYRYRDPFFDFLYGPQRKNISGMGSGVIIDPGGFIITNNHVVSVGGRTGSIEVFLTDGRKFDARVIRDFPDQDLTVLSIKGKDLPSLEIGSSSSVMPGQTVLAIGNPFGDQLAGGLSYSEPTVTRGIISATRRNLTVPTETGGVRYLRNMLQTDAAINQGNSGGALIDLNGKLIGVNTAIISPDGRVSVGIGFAIPAERVKFILEQVRKRENVGQWYTGISVQDLTEYFARAVGFTGDGGAVIIRIEEGSPGGRSGLNPGDIVVQVNGFTIRSKDELFSMFRGSVPGEVFKIVLFRHGKTIDRELKLESR